MNDDIFGNFFGEKPHRDGALAESRWGLNSYEYEKIGKQMEESQNGTNDQSNG